jgi:hypothetical protein
MKSTLFAVAALAAVGLTAPANAMAPGLAKDLIATAPASMAETVHFSHRTCQLGRFGWHFHDRFRNRIACRPFRTYRR